MDKAVIDEAAESVANSFLELGVEAVARNRDDNAAFLARHRSRWSRSLQLAEVFLFASLELGREINSAERPAAAARNDAKFEALIRNHARAVRVGEEIYLLASQGYPDGACARWRTLHEIATVCLFLSAQPTEISERFLLHDLVESRRSARSHSEHSVDLGCVSPTAEELADLEARVNSLRDTYGERFPTANEWARPAFPDIAPKAPIRFADIENAVGLQRWRPRYLTASQLVHASPKAAYWSLGFGRMDDLITAGPSMEGVPEALHPLFISLNQVSGCLATVFATHERLVVLRALMILSDRAGQALLDEHEARNRDA